MTVTQLKTGCALLLGFLCIIDNNIVYLQNQAANDDDPKAVGSTHYRPHDFVAIQLTKPVGY